MTIDYKEMCLKNSEPTNVDAVRDLIGDSGWYMINNDVMFNSDYPNPISKSVIDFRLMELKEMYNKHIYLRQRKAALSQHSTEDQLDMMYYDAVNNTELWKEWRDQINTIYPRPSDSLF